MTSIDDVLAEMTARTCTVYVLLRQDLITRHAELEARLAEAITAGKDSLETEAPRLARELVEFEAETEAAKRAFTFKAIGRQKWTKLLALHPPTKEQQRMGVDHNPETFPYTAIAESCVDPVMTVQQVAQLDERMNVAQFDMLWAGCLDANVGTNSTPKSLAAGGIARANAASGTTPASEGSPAQSSSVG